MKNRKPLTGFVMVIVFFLASVYLTSIDSKIKYDDGDTTEKSLKEYNGYYEEDFEFDFGSVDWNINNGVYDVKYSAIDSTLTINDRLYQGHPIGYEEENTMTGIGYNQYPVKENK